MFKFMSCNLRHIDKVFKNPFWNERTPTIEQKDRYIYINYQEAN